MTKSVKENKVTSFIKGSSILVISNVCLKAINFFLLPLYTNNLTPSMIGVSDSITNLTGIMLPILTMGLDSAFSAFYFDKDDSNRSDKVYSTLALFFIILGFIPLFLMIVASPISQFLFKSKDYYYIVRFAMISVSFNLWYLPYSLELRLKNKMLLFGLSNILASLTMILLNILFVSVIHLGEASLVLSTMFVNVEQLFVLFAFVRNVPKRNNFDSILLKKMLMFAIPLMPMTLMMWVLSLSDRYVLLHYHGSGVVGLYGIGFRFTNLLNVVISAVSMAYTTFAFSSRDDTNSKKNYYYIYSIESLLLMAIAFTFGLFGKEIIQIMTSASYETSYVALRDLMFAQTFYAMTSIVGYGIYFEKKSIYSLMAVTAGAMINLLLNFILIPQYGIQAAAFTTLIGYCVNYFLTLYFSEKLYPCDYGHKKVLFVLGILYIVCFASAELQIQYKLMIWLLAASIVLLVFKNIILIVIRYVNNMLIHRRS